LPKVIAKLPEPTILKGHAMILSHQYASTNIFKTVMKYAVLLCSCAAVMPAGQAAVDPAKPVNDLVQRFTEAQQKMDVPALKALTAENYVEVSPLGEVDMREKMLTFYVRDEKQVPPAMTVEDITTRLLGDTAVVVAKVSYTSVIEGQSRTFSLRSTFVAEKLGGVWKLVSAHYTPIRPKNPG
jgi:ketosteroid isomerase-like protein